jgi:hypothetical protein
MPKTRRDEAQHIHESPEHDPRVVIHPENDDLFVQSADQVIIACSLRISVELWLEELSAVFGRVRSKIEAHKSKIQSCFCVPTGGKLTFFFVSSSEQFDFDLADELGDLSVELMKDFNVGMVEAHQIPSSESARFIDPSAARKIYGDKLTTHSPVET